MTNRIPRQKIIRFNNPKYSSRDKDIWPWIMAQGKHVTRSLHLLINVAQAENGNVDYTKAVIKRAITNQSQTNPSKSENGGLNTNKEINHKENHKNDNTKVHQKSRQGIKNAQSQGPKKMSHDQLKNAFLN